jgi:tripartite ATP-independent transporter DctP family solute receptor
MHISLKHSLLGALVAFGLGTGTAAAETWRLGHIMPPDHPANRALEEAAKEIATRTEGRITIEVYPAGQIGSAKEIVTGLTLGTVQMAVDGPGILSQWNPRLSVLEAPYLATDFAHLTRIVESPEGVKLYDELREQHGIRLLDVWYYGTRHLTNNVRPVNDLADIAGLKLRVPEIALSLEWAKAMGATPTPMAFPELYLGLQTGIVDGQENPLATIKSAKFFEVQKHLALTGHLVSLIAPMVAETSWTAASADDQAIVVEVLKAAGDKYDQAMTDLEASLVADLKASGMQVTEPDRDAMRDAVRPVYEQFSEQWGAGTIDALSAIE